MCRTALALLLFTVACVPASAPPAVVPAVDHHQHLLSPAGAALVNRILPPVGLPEPLASLLSARVTAWNNAAALRDLYTEDALVLGPESPGWIRGRDDVAKMLSSVFARAYDLLPTSYRIEGSSAFIAGYLTRNAGTVVRPIGYFFVDLQQRADGAWQIAAETPIIPGPHQEPVVTAEDLIALLDAAGIARAVVLSDAYYFDAPDLPAGLADVAAVRAENDWTAEQVARYPGRLVAICSVNPLAAYAVGEVDRCANSGRFDGLKLHFDTSAVDLLNPDHVQKVRLVAAAANRGRLPLIIHARMGGASGREHALVLLNEIITAAPDVVTQIAHLWGGQAFSEPALSAYAEAVEAEHPATRRLYFDVAQMWNASDEDLKRAVALMRRIGIKRMLYASDGPQFGGVPPAEAWQRFRARVPLTDHELGAIAGNVAPYL
ncbi:MAG TPA: amidohydrolase family protein [Thermoanaerobaculia bacterium]|nr:amidohydrolase family protein [Thermoanaerobaculia bacterium]